MLTPKLLLKVLPAVLLSFGQVVGMSEMARSQPLEASRSGAIAQVSPSETEKLDRLTQQLKSGDPQVRLFAAEPLGTWVDLPKPQSPV
jgi:hypothetical protein